MSGELSSERGELSSECGASCLVASFLWGELSWGELSLGRVVRNPSQYCHLRPHGLKMRCAVHTCDIILDANREMWALKLYFVF